MSKTHADNPSPDLMSVLQSLRDYEARPIAWPPIGWVFLANTTLEPLFPFIKHACFDIGYKADLRGGGFDTALQDATASASPLFAPLPDVVVVALRLHVLAPPLVDRFAELGDATASEARRAVDYVCAVVAALRQRAPASLILVHGFETPLYPEFGILDFRHAAGQVNTVRRMNLELAERLSREANVFIVDLDAVRARVGAERFEDTRTWHIGRIAYSREAMAAICGEYMKAVRALKGRSRKCLVVDADNTLWGGIVGEDGVDGLVIGRTFPGSAYYEFQQALLALRERGVILALCSKNDPDAVAEVFARRAADMPLRLEHFAATRVNWSDKAENLRAIAAELNIGLDSLVFADDSRFEVELVRELLPDVHAILLPAEATRFRPVLAQCGLFDTLTVSDEDRRRNELYAEERRRQADRTSSAVSVEEYLAGLAIEVEIAAADDAAVPRVAQLTQKTNQFNLTTVRYSEGDIRALVSAADSDVLAVRVRDRFGDSGLVGVAILRHAGGSSTIDTLLLSCRVLGRGIEDALLAACADTSRARGSVDLIGVYAPTSRNGQVSGFYQARGFEPAGEHRFRRAIGAGSPAFARPAHLRTVNVKGRQGDDAR